MNNKKAEQKRLSKTGKSASDIAKNKPNIRMGNFDSISELEKKSRPNKPVGLDYSDSRFNLKKKIM